ncbi:MAG: Uma2 family endonuclease [Cyanobacteria bacterium P01_G01_bin.54]
MVYAQPQLPTSDQLPCSDDIPVDNEDQNLLPNYLLFLLNWIWQARDDWYFGVDMAIYHTTGVSPNVPVMPDGFLSVGVPRRKPGNQSRRGYVVWEEDNIVPLWVLEMVSWTPGGEYEKKLDIYERLGVRYYVIYNPDYWQRDGHPPLEIYKLINGQYQLQWGEPYWLPELELAIGRSRGMIGGVERELLSWFDRAGDRYLSAAERAEQAQVQAQAERQARLQAIPQLHQLGLSATQIAAALGLSVEIVEQQLS